MLTSDDAPPPPESYGVMASLLFSTDRVSIDSFRIDGLEEASAPSHQTSEPTKMQLWPYFRHLRGSMQCPPVFPSYERR